MLQKVYLIYDYEPYDTIIPVHTQTVNTYFIEKNS